MRSSVAEATIPALPGLPLVGNLPAFARHRLGVLARVFAACGPIAELRLGPRRAIVVTSPELAQEVLVKQNGSFRKFAALTRYSRPMLGEGLLTAEGDAHLRQRRLIAPSLKRSHIASYVEAMSRHAEALVEAWRHAGVVDVHAGTHRMTLGIAAETLFGTDASQYAETVGRAVQYQTAYTAAELGRLVHLPMTWPTPRNLALRAHVAAVDRIVYDLIAARRRQTGARPDDLLTRLLDARDEVDGAQMTDLQVRDEVITLLAAGHETVANSAAFTLWLIAAHPTVQARLADEGRAVLGGRRPTFDDLPRLGYALAVFKESMRLYPPAYLVGRETVAPITLGGHSIPADTMVIVNLYGLHRRADLFPLPERFDPDRFTAEREKALPRGAYLPFADGPRVCVGNHFSLVEGQVVVAHLVQRLQLETTGPAPEPKPQLTLQPKRPFHLRVSGRG